MDPQKLMGFVTPGDKKVPVSVRDWDAMKRALWHSKNSWDIVLRESTGLLARCAHMEGCPGKEDETAPCLPDCPDREMRLSMLVILTTARQFESVNAHRPADAPYFAPSREHFSEVLAELAACQVEIETLRSKVGSTESESVHTLATAIDPPQLKEKTP
jgi:hypothetical protein